MDYNVQELFKKAKKEYGQDASAFYVATKSYDNSGFHLAILPPYRRKAFSEYILGHKEDVDKLKDLWRDKTIFKSLYCSMCSMEEPDNYAEENKIGDLHIAKNFSYVVNKKITISNVDFLISGTVPQYFYNHLLLSTVVHFSTYLIFLIPNIFKGVFKFIKDNSVILPNIKAIFNGTFGSDVWHAHVHITDQKLYIIEKIKESISRSKFGAFNKFSNWKETQYLTVRVIIGEDLEWVFWETLRWIFPIFGMNRTNYFLSANFFYHLGHYCLVLMLGKKIMMMKTSRGEMVNFIYPGFLINLSNLSNITQGDINEVFSFLKREKIFLKWDPVDRNRDISLLIKKYSPPKENWGPDIPVEFLQWEFTVRSKNREEMCDMLSHFLGIAKLNPENDPLTIECSLRSRNCPDRYHSFYKYILTLYVLCYFDKHPTNFYERLMEKDGVLKQAIYGELYYMHNTYGIRDSRSLYLRGVLGQEIVRRTASDLILLKSKIKVIPTDLLIPQGEYVNYWIDYKLSGNIIGDPSAMGIIVRSNFQRISPMKFVIKVNKEPTRKLAIEMFIHEFSVGMQVNNLRRRIPNFLLTLGGISCRSNDNLNTLCKPVWGMSKNYQYIILEYISNATTLSGWMDRYIGIHNDEKDQEISFMNIIMQILISLAYAIKKTKFTHYDLHVGNIMIFNFVNQSEWINYIRNVQKIRGQPTNTPLEPFFRYRIDNKTYDIPAEDLVFIIDYGTSYINGLKNYPLFSEVTHEGQRDFRTLYGMTSNISKPSADVYTLFISTFIGILQKNPSLIIKNGLLRTDNIIGKFYHLLWKGFNYIFTHNYPIIIGSLLRSPVLNRRNVLTGYRIDKRDSYYLPYNENPNITPEIILDKIITPLKNYSIYSPNVIFQWGDFPRDERGIYFSKDRLERKEKDVQKKKIQTLRAKT